MSAQASFPDLIRRVRAGDEQACTDLVRQFEPEIRRYIRVRLTSPAVQRLKESADIFQSVAANFFVRVIGGDYDLDQPEHVARLLMRMAKNRLIDEVRKKGNRVTQDAGSEVWDGVAEGGATPSRVIASRELLDEAKRRMTDDERHLALMRADGMKWDDIAAAVGRSPEAVRKQVERACDRVCAELHLDEASDA
jgi:RNA polymerase sigma factor (sigma-70 family)